MEFFRDSNYNFMGARKVCTGVSLLLVIAAIVAVFVQRRLNIGIDFAGGTQLTLRFSDQPDVQQLREILQQEGIEEAQIQRFGEAEANEVMIKTPTDEGEDEGSRGRIEVALGKALNDSSDRFDLNQKGREALSSLLFGADPESKLIEGESTARTYYAGVADAVMKVREEDGLLRGWEQLEGVVATPTLDALKERAMIGSFAVLAAENVGPQIGAELRTKGIAAVAFSLLGMLVYIWLRFELRFGIGALTALIHDVLVALGLYSILGYEFNLTTVAAFLTVVGYSVNDTVVVFDRVRENLRRSRREPMIDVLNTSLNQTLSRTLLTSGTTLLAVGTLFFLGGDVMRGFSFVLMIGIIVGTYSSIFVASPVVLLWEGLRSKSSKR